MSFDNSGNLMVEMRDDSESEGDTDISQERNQAGGDGVRRPDEARDNRKRGTNPGTKRGKYNKVSVEARKRIRQVETGRSRPGQMECRSKQPTST